MIQYRPPSSVESDEAFVSHGDRLPVHYAGLLAWLRSAVFGTVYQRMTRIGAVLLLAGSLFSAEAKMLAMSGDWKAIADLDNGKPRCGVSNNNPAQYLQVFFTQGDDHVSLQVSSSDWRLSDGKEYGLTMQFDQNDPWTAGRAQSGRYDDGASFIDADITEGLERWLKQFEQANYVVVSFRGVRPWVLDLSGTDIVMRAFGQCVGVLLKSRAK